MSLEVFEKLEAKVQHIQFFRIFIFEFETV